MSDVPEKKRHIQFQINKFILVLAEHRHTKLNINAKRLFKTCSSSSPSSPHSSSLKLYDVIFVFSFPMFRCVFFSLVFLWSFSLSSFSALPHSSTRVLAKIAERQEVHMARKPPFVHPENPTQKECLNESAAQSTVMSQFFFKLPSKKQDKGVWNVRWPYIYEAVPFFCGGPSLYYSSVACSLCPASVRSFASPGIPNQERAAPLRVAEDLGRTPTEVSCYARKQKWGRGQMMASLGIFSRFFFGKNVSGASSCHVPIQKQNGLDVVDQDDMLFSLS